MEKINLPDIGKLKEILVCSELASSYKRNNLLLDIGLDNNFAGKNIDNYNDEDFAGTLINFLENTQQLEILIKLCQKMESVIKNGPNNICLRAIKKRMEVFNIVIVNLESNQELFYQSYKLALLHRDIHIPSNSNPIESIENLDANEIIKNINKLDSYRVKNFSLLDIFLGYLTESLIQEDSELFQEFNKWREIHLNNDLINFIKSQQVDNRNNQENNDDPCLLITIEPGNGNLIFKAWLIENINKYCHYQDNGWEEISKGLQYKIKLSFDNLHHHLPQLIDELLFKISDQVGIVKKMHFFLPYKFLVPIDCFLIKRQRRELYLGAHYEVNIRFLERTKKPVNIDEKEIMLNWKDKCNKLKEKIKNNNNIEFTPLKYSADIEELIDNLYDKEATQLSFVVQTDETEKIMDILYNASIPLAVWVRKEVNNYEKDLDDITCQASCLKTLSELVKKQREAANRERRNKTNNHIGHYLSFLWDDYNLLPPKPQLSMPS